MQYRLNVRQKTAARRIWPSMPLRTDYRGQETLDEVKTLVEIGVPTMKLFLAYRARRSWTTPSSWPSCSEAKKYGMTMTVHAETPTFWTCTVTLWLEQGCLAPQVPLW